MIGIGSIGLGALATCSPWSDANCPYYCLWAQTNSCSTDPSVRAAAAPWYCSLPYAAASQTCQQANDQSLVSASGLSAQNKAALLQQFQETDQQQCAAHPEDCAALKAVQDPCTAVFGTGAVGQLFCGQSGQGFDLTTFALLAGAGVILLMAATR